MSEKRCSKCKEFRNYSEYYSDKRATDGLASQCKTCNAGYRTKNIGRNAHLKSVPEEPEGQRWCTECEQMKSLDEFGTHRTRIGVFYRRYCQPCRREMNKKGYAEYPEKYTKWYKNNKEDVQKNNRQKYATDKEYSSKIREGNRRWRKENPEKSKQSIENCHKKRPELYLELHKVSMNRRRARVLSLPNGFSRQDWMLCLDYFENKCAICGQRPDSDTGIVLAIDHWIPIASKDANNPGTVSDNIVPLCHARRKSTRVLKVCNNSKTNHDPVQWLYSRYPQAEADVILARINTYFDIVRSKQQEVF